VINDLAQKEFLGLSAQKRSRRARSGRTAKRSIDSRNSHDASPSKDAVKAAEEIALATFASGLKLAAAFGTVAAKTASLALASIATGADKFSELVKQETLRDRVRQPIGDGLSTRSQRLSRRTSRQPAKRNSARNPTSA